MQALISTVGQVGGFMLLSFWMLGGLVGAILAAMQEELVSMVLSIFIPGYGCVYTIATLIGG